MPRWNNPNCGFQKGYTPWNKGGTSWNKGLRGVQVAWNKGLKYEHGFKQGHVVSAKTRKKISEANLKNPTRYWLGKQRPEISGKNHYLWQGGNKEYGIEFNRTLKEQIRKRDHCRCQECFRHQDELCDKVGRKYKLLIHHIDYNKKNNRPENLISLCRNCHLQTVWKRENWIKYFQEKITTQ